MEAITLKCPHCGTMLTVPDTYIGRTSKCGRCRLDVFIRAPKAQAEIRPSARSNQWYGIAAKVALAALALIFLAILGSYFI